MDPPNPWGLYKLRPKMASNTSDSESEKSFGDKTEGTQKLLLRYILFNGTEQLVREITRALAALPYTLAPAELLVMLYIC